MKIQKKKVTMSLPKEVVQNVKSYAEEKGYTFSGIVKRKLIQELKENESRN